MDEAHREELLKRKEGLASEIASELHKDAPDSEKIDSLRREMEKHDMMIYVKFSDQLVKTELKAELDKFIYLLQTRKKLTHAQALGELKFADAAHAEMFFHYVRSLPNVKVGKRGFWLFGQDTYELK